MQMRTVLAIGIAAAIACSAPGSTVTGTPPTATVSAPTAPGTGTTSASARPPATRYEATVLTASGPESADGLAISESQIFVSLNGAGGRQGAPSSIATAPLSGGQFITLAGTETADGQITGLAVFNGSVFFSRLSSGPSKGAVYRVVAGEVQLVAGAPGATAPQPLQGDGGPAIGAPLFGPAGLAFNPAGDLFIAETGSGTIRRVSAGRIDRIAGRGPCADIGNPPRPGSAAEVALCAPQHLAVNQFGEIFVNAPPGPWIAKIDGPGALSVLTHLRASALAVDVSGALLASDFEGDASGRVMRLDNSGTPIALATGLGSVRGLAVGPDGSIYVLAMLNGATAITRLRPLG